MRYNPSTHALKPHLLAPLLVALAACGQTAQPGIPESGGTPLQPQGLNFVVNTVSDWPDAAPGNGVCGTWIGNCSLRAAIEEANDTPGKDTVNVPANVYKLENGQLEVKDHLVVMGTLQGTTTIDAQGKSRIFNIDDSAYNGEGTLRVELHRLVMRNGYSSSAGGAIRNDGAKVLVNKSTIVANNAYGWAGGIHNDTGGTFELKYSTVVGNGNMTTDEPARGGGIVNGSDSSFLVFKSSIHHNEANRFGGIANYGSMNIVNATVSTNKSRIDSGGILNAGRLNMNNTTVAFNEGTIEYDGGTVPTGGLHNVGTVRMGNSIVAQNQSHFSTSQDCSGTITSMGYNLIQDTTDCTIGGDLTGNLTGVDPILQALGLNDGLTESHGLPAGSPARDAGNPAVANGVGTACEATDQRDRNRGVGPAGRCDMGAYEFKGAPGGFGP